jgi:hypothetical protein
MQIRNKVLVLCSYVALLSASGYSIADDRIGVIGAANKNITAIGQDTTKRDLKLGDNIYFKDKISADKTGNAQLLFVDKSALTVGPNSSVVIDEFVYNPSTSSGNMVMQGTKGTFRFIGGALSKQNAVKIKTPVGTIGIRGGIAIVQINPDTGATNATFVYGDKLTFQNMAGDMQTVTNTGAGIKLDTPTSAPTVFQMTTTQMAAQVGELAGKVGTSAGAAVVPTEKDVGKGLTVGNDKGTGTDGKAPIGDGKTGPNGDRGDGKTNGDGKNGNNNGGNNANGTNPPKTGSATGVNDPGSKLTSDGGYVDSKGNYHTPAELAAERANGNTGTAAGSNGNANGNGYVAGGTATGGAYGGGTTGPNGAIQLTSDGGYKDNNGNYHTPAELAAYRASNPGANGAPAGGMAGGYVAGGYNGGTAATGGYGGPAAAPVGGTGYVAGGANTYGGTAAGGYAPAGGTAATGYYGTAAAPVAGGYGSAAGSYGGGYVAPTAPNNYAAVGGAYYQPITSAYFNTAPVYGPAYGSTYAAIPPIGGYNNYGGTNYYDPAAANAATAAAATNNGYNNYGNIDATALNLYNEAYSRVINAGGTSAQALAAAVVAQNYFKDHVLTGSDFNAAITATQVNTTTYINTYFPGGGGGGGTGFTAGLQNTQNSNLNSNISGKTTYSTDSVALPVGNVGSTLFNQQAFNNKDNLKATMTAGKVANCSSCAYVDWDVWASVTPDSSTTAASATAKLVPYIFGTPTAAANIPGGGGAINAIYTGSSTLTTSGYGNEIGTIHANITLNGAGSANLTHFDFTVPSQAATLNFGGNQAMNTGSFSGINVNGGGLSGTVNGALFGPNAENVGGNLTYGTGGATTGLGAGVYIGARP